MLSYRLYSCGDDRSDRCTQPVDEILDPSSTCSVAVSADDPFGPLAPNGPGEAYPFDVKANCDVVMTDFDDPATLVNTCSYHSQEPENSDPEDCVLIPRDGFLQIVKVATPDDSSAEFDFTIDSRPTPDFTAHGSETSLLIPIAAGTHSIAESLPANWQLDSVSCKKQSGTATGTGSGNWVTGVATESDKTTTCTFNNSLQAGTLVVKKQVVNDNGGLLGASDFSLHVKKDDTDVDTSPQDGSETGTTYNLIVGDYISQRGDAALRIQRDRVHRRLQQQRLGDPGGGRRGHLHDHQRRHRTEAAPAQGRRQRQRRHRDRGRLHAERQRNRHQRPSGSSPVDSRPGLQAGHLRAV